MTQACYHSLSLVLDGVARKTRVSKLGSAVEESANAHAASCRHVFFGYSCYNFSCGHILWIFIQLVYSCFGSFLWVSVYCFHKLQFQRKARWCFAHPVMAEVDYGDRRWHSAFCSQFVKVSTVLTPVIHADLVPLICVLLLCKLVAVFPNRKAIIT